MYWHSPWLYLLIPVGFYLILALAIREKADIQIGLSARRKARRLWVIFGACVGSLTGFALFLSPLFEKNDQPMSPVWFLSGIILLISSLIVAVTAPRIVTPAKITKDYVWLKGVHPEYLTALPEFPGK